MMQTDVKMAGDGTKDTRRSDVDAGEAAMEGG